MIRSRWAVLSLLTLCLFQPFGVRASEATEVAAARKKAEEAVQIFRKDAGALWGKRLDDIPWFMILDQKVYLTADPKIEGYSASKGFWTGPLPTDIAPSNSSLEWAGRKWAMVTLPLPPDAKEALRLMIHEAWHVAQPTVLPLPRFKENGPGATQLNEPEGRIWLQLEYRALVDALRTEGQEQEKAITGALLFRAQRYALATDDERDRQRLLDLHEGLAEYTAWKLSGGTPADFISYLQKTAYSLGSYVRTFPYFTGPAYATLLDQRLPGWTKLLPQTHDLQFLLAGTLKNKAEWMKTFLKGSGSRPELAELAEKAGHPWDLATLRKKEAAQWEERQRKIEELKKTFVEGPTLRIRPKGLKISFNPSQQISLGDKGTVMTKLIWKEATGSSLSAPQALVSSDWKELRVALDPTLKMESGTLDKAREWKGADWVLSLSKGWKIRAEGSSWVAEP